MRSFLTRLSIGVGIAVVLTIGLSLWVGEAPAPPILEPEPTMSGEPAHVGDDFPHGQPWLVYLGRTGRPLPGAVAPVFEIRPGGALIARRAVPVAMAPGDRSRWLAAGVILPARRLGELSPVERSTLLAVLRAWRAPGAVESSRLTRWGVAASRIELAGLCRWER